MYIYGVDNLRELIIQAYEGIGIENRTKRQYENIGKCCQVSRKYFKNGDKRLRAILNLDFKKEGSVLSTNGVVFKKRKDDWLRLRKEYGDYRGGVLASIGGYKITRSSYNDYCWSFRYYYKMGEFITCPSDIKSNLKRPTNEHYKGPFNEENWSLMSYSQLKKLKKII